MKDKFRANIKLALPAALVTLAILVVYALRNPAASLDTYDYNIWEVKVVVSPRHQSLDYQRGALDTLATNTSLAFFPSFSVHIFPTKKYSKEITFSASHSIYEPSLQNRITYRDDSQPLVVKLGNPNLKGNESTRLTADFFSRGTHQHLLHVGATFDYLHRATAQSVIYNPQSGVYTYRPENISGNYNVTAKMDFSRSLGEKRLWTVSTNADANYYHSLDHSMLVGDTESHVNAVNTLTLHDNAYIQYNKGTLNVRATGDIRWRHSEGKMQDFETLNATDFQYGLSARYILPRLNTTLSADGNMYSRRGYGSSELNTDDFVLNASISQPFFKSSPASKPSTCSTSSATPSTPSTPRAAPKRGTAPCRTTSWRI